MKILLITNLYPSKKYPHYGVFVKNTYEMLCKHYKIKLVALKKHDKKIIKLVAYILFYAKTIISGISGKYDCIYAHYISHCELPVRIIKFFHKNILVIGNVHGEDVFSDYDEYKVNQNKARKFMSMSDYLISPSSYYKERLTKEYGFPKNRIFISPSGGINASVFYPDDKLICRKHFGLEEKEYILGFVSRIEKGKGWDCFLQAASELIRNNKIENLRIIIVGSGNEKMQMQKYIDKLNLKKYVHIMEALEQAELHFLYNSLDIFVFPTRREAESLGLVGIEAMACAVPCVISDAGGPLSYAKDKINSLIFDKNNYHDLEEKVLEIYNMDKYQKDELSENAMLTARKYEKQEVEKTLLQFFGRIEKDLIC